MNWVFSIFQFDNEADVPDTVKLNVRVWLIGSPSAVGIPTVGHMKSAPTSVVIAIGYVQRLMNVPHEVDDPTQSQRPFLGLLRR